MSDLGIKDIEELKRLIALIDQNNKELEKQIEVKKEIINSLKNEIETNYNS